MFAFDVVRWVPKFILQDKNGYALAKAIETGLQAMNDMIEAGVLCVTDVGSMPEWRLDEMAWETACLYDYAAPLETKREWIAHAGELARIGGTPKILKNYLLRYFGDVSLEEAADYGGAAFTFRVSAAGAGSDAGTAARMMEMIERGKNARSVLDRATLRYEDSAQMFSALVLSSSKDYDIACETPDASRLQAKYFVDELGNYLCDENGARFIDKEEEE